jgi:hypothetical protein
MLFALTSRKGCYTHEDAFGLEGELSKIFQLDGEKSSLSFVPGQRITYVAEGHRYVNWPSSPKVKKKL